jgi:tetratricopeptide (TPR) repeat protein
VNAVLAGSFYERSGTKYIEVRLIGNGNSLPLWSQTFSQLNLDLLQMEDEIAASLVEKGLNLKLNDNDRRRLVVRLSADPEANQLYDRGMKHQHDEDEAGYLESRKLFVSAIEKDRNFALAYVGLASSYQVMAIDGYESPQDNAPEVHKNIETALKLAPNLIEAHYARAAELLQFDWNWPSAEKEFQRATAVPSAWDVDAAVLSYWAMGQTEQALVLIRKALYTNTLNPAWRLKEADLLAYLGRYEEAVKKYQQIISDEKGDPRAYFGLAEVKRIQGHFDEAVDQLRQGWKKKVIERGDILDEELAHLLESARGEEGFRRIEHRTIQLELDGLDDRNASGDYTSPLDFARAYAQLGERERALEYLENALNDRSPGLIFLNVDPAWKTFRKDSRFLSVMKKVGLPWQ